MRPTRPAHALIARTAQLLLLSSLASACVVKRETVRALPISKDPKETSGPRIDVEGFLDRRGEDAVKYSATRMIPIVDLFHMAETYLLPEQTAAIRSEANGGATIVTGALERDLPYHLARTISADFGRGITDDADFHVLGTIEESAIKVHINILPGALLSIVGVPYLYTSFELRWTMTVIRCGDREHPVIQKTYDYSGRERTSAVYGAMAPRKLLIAGITKTIHEARTDILALVAASGPCSAPTPTLPAAPPQPAKPRR